MVRGTAHLECAELAEYHVQAAHRILTPAGDHDTVSDDTRATAASYAAIKAGALQLALDDPVRAQALKFVADGPHFAGQYFAPCGKEKNQADVGELTIPRH
jgi:hypothetical protein